jgi:CPA2 family monovalent cation:H+ antiporter-2
VVLMALLTAVASGAGLSAGPLAVTVARLAAFLTGLVVVGMLVVPRVMRLVVRLDRRETTLVASVGICFATALLAQAFGYSVAIGAFLAGSLVAESGEGRLVEHIIEPVRDMFAAVFFVSVGMMIEPALIARHWPAVVVLTVVVVLGKIGGVSLGAFLTGNGLRRSVQAGFSLAQIGEFSFIIAALGLTLRATGEFLYPVAVAVSALTTLFTPWLIRAAEPAATWADRTLPRSLQTFTVLYGSWIEGLRSRPRAGRTEVRRLLRLLVLDAVIIAAIVIAASASMTQAVALARDRVGIPEIVARLLLLALAALVAAPFAIGVVRVSQMLGLTLARLALPAEKDKRVDFAAAPRRTLTVTLQLAGVLLVGMLLLALAQPFLPGALGAGVLGVALVLLGIGFWRSAANLHGHVRAGAQVVLEAIAGQSRGPAPRPEGRGAALERVHELLPGLGDLAAVRLEPHAPVTGRTLADLNLRGRTGATVLAITRQEGGVVVPSAQEVLREGDVLALAGSREAIEAATDLLRGRTPLA